MGTFIVLASLAVISGLIFLAFKHPHAYRRVSFPIRALVFSAVLAAGAWSAGFLNGINSMRPHLKEGQGNETGRLMSENVEAMSNIMRGGLVVLACDILLIPPLLRLLKKDEQEETPE